MRPPKEIYRLLQRRMPALLIAASLCHASWADGTVCIDATEYRRLAKRYDDLRAQFDLPNIAQEFLDVSGETQDLKEQVTACRKNVPASDRQDCAVPAGQYGAMLVRLEMIGNRFNTALDMQEYLHSLKLRLEQSQCEK